jgi:hypothetical protein
MDQLTRPRRETTENGWRLPARPEKLPKQVFLHVLHKAGVPKQTIKATDEQLQDPVDLERDGLFLVTHGLDRDQLMDRMGGSP